MSKLNGPLSTEENKLLFQLWDDSRTGKGRYYSVRQLAIYFNCNQPRILKELKLWKGFQRFQEKRPGIEFPTISMEEVQKEYGNENST